MEKMRTALFSDNERGMIEHYLETGEKGDGFRVLAHRTRWNQTKIKEDFDLMNRLLERLADLQGEKEEKA